MSGRGLQWDRHNEKKRMAERGTEQAYGKVELRASLNPEAMLVNAARGGVSKRTLEWLANPEPPLPDPVDLDTPERDEWHLAVLGSYEPTAAYYGEW